jgi:hypothetical protein
LKSRLGVDDSTDLEYPLLTFLWHDIQKENIKQELGVIVLSQSELFGNWSFRAWGFRPEDARLFFHSLILFKMLIVAPVTTFERRARARNDDDSFALVQLQIVSRPAPIYSADLN